MKHALLTEVPHNIRTEQIPNTVYSDMPTFITAHPILTGWLVFVMAVYLYAYLDYAYYRYGIRQKVLRIYEALTEEE